MLAIFDRKSGTFSCTTNREHLPEPIGPDGVTDQQSHANMRLSPSLFTRDNSHFFLFGCIDNRDDLCKLLGIDQSKQKSVTNGELLSRLVTAYGDDTPTKLYGNWLYVIYDDRKKALSLAQNHHEYAALYYHEAKDHFSFSTSQQWLLSLDHVPRELDLLKIVQRDAVISGLSKDTTFFKGIRLLNPAHQMKVTQTKIQRERYWHPERILTDHRISHGEAVEQMRFLVRQAVHKRINHVRSVASMLSGGLDSGSVVSMASELLGQQGRSLHTYSHVPRFDLDGLDIGRRNGNEQPFMEATAGRHANIITHFHNSAHLSPLQGIREINRILLEPIHAACNAYWIVDIKAQAAADGHGTLLSGEMGNATTSYTGCLDALAGRILLQRFGLKRYVKQRILEPPYLLAKRCLNLAKQRGRVWQTYSYLHPRLAEAIDLEMMIKQSGRPMDFSALRFTNHQDQMQRILMVGFNPRLRNQFILGRHFDLELRDPTGDVHLIEFLLSLPNEFYFGPNGELKWML